MVLYRFLDGMGDVVAGRECVDHAAALRWAQEDDEIDVEIQWVEFLGQTAIGDGPGLCRVEASRGSTHHAARITHA